MGLLNLFQKKDPAIYLPRNSFEENFWAAATDPSRRHLFMKELLEQNVFVFGSAETRPDGSQYASFLQKEVEGVRCAMAFTSIEAMEWFLSFYKQPTQNYVGLKCSVLFEMLKEVHGVILNMGHTCSKIFTKEEMASMLRPVDVVTIPAGENLYVGKPAVRPEKLIDTLSRFFSDDTRVKSVYLGLMQVGTVPKKSYIVLVEFGEGMPADLQPRFLEGITSFIHLVPTDLPVDVSVLTPNSVFAPMLSLDCFETIKPASIQ